MQAIIKISITITTKQPFNSKYEDKMIVKNGVVFLPKVLKGRIKLWTIKKYINQNLWFYSSVPKDNSSFLKFTLKVKHGSLVGGFHSNSFSTSSHFYITKTIPSFLRFLLLKVLFYFISIKNESKFPFKQMFKIIIQPDVTRKDSFPYFICFLHVSTALLRRFLPDEKQEEKNLYSCGEDKVSKYL